MSNRDPWAKYKKPQRDSALFEMYLKNPDLSLAEIGRHFNISRERTRQIVEREKNKQEAVEEISTA